MADGSFPYDDFRHTARLLRGDNEAVRKATLSNNLNIIIAALDIAAGSRMLDAKQWEAVFDALDQVLAGDHEANDLPMSVYQMAYDKLSLWRRCGGDDEDAPE